MGWGRPEGMVRRGPGTIQTLHLHPDLPDQESVCPLILVPCGEGVHEGRMLRPVRSYSPVPLCGWFSR